MTIVALRWTVSILLVLAAIVAWRSGLLAESSLDGLKSRQNPRPAWTSDHDWRSAGAPGHALRLAVRFFDWGRS